MKKNETEQIRIGSRVFAKYLHRDTIKARIQELGRDISMDYQDKFPVFIVVLNGAFMFAADLVRATAMECQLEFVKLASYEDVRSTGTIKKIIGIPIPLEGRHVIIVEDIVDTGRTMDSMIKELKTMDPASVSVATLLYKPDCLQVAIESTYVGFEIPDAFVIGYGLDLDGKARNLPDIYQLAFEDDGTVEG
ncbi:MAG: hypoxanthine phosphoribosyltransferase [Saprospiraceae bacterium]|nr:hypoxanthine phosphoribosyltransferase [Saprospiraceae bacterium]